MLNMELSYVPKAGVEQNQFTGLASDSRRLKLLLVDDHSLYRESLARLLTSELDFELFAQCRDAQQALQLMHGSAADVVLVDIVLADNLIQVMRKAGHNCKYLVLGTDVTAKTCAVVLRNGASGIFLASDSACRLPQAIRLVAAGDAWVEQKIVQMLAANFADFDRKWASGLTNRETSVLRGVVDGLSNKKIGDQIGVSEGTIKATLQHLFKKAGVRTRSQLVRIALESPSLTKADTP